jgi:glyoxylase-like metal-dependent hydrolase (beta-lactamase superfamily II)
MVAKKLQPHLYMVTQRIPTGSVNAYIIVTPDGIVLVDTGYLNNGSRMMKALEEIGHQASDIQHILVTHGHADHIGSLAHLKRASGARTYMHRLDRDMAQQGSALREATHGTPGWLNQMAFAMGVRLLVKTVEPSPVDIVVDDHEQLAIAGGIRVIHVPGHSAGQVAYLWEEQGVLFAADAVAHLFGKLRYGPVVEDFSLLQQSIQRLCGLTFETACFGHGEPLIGNASSRFRERWA